MMGKLKVFTTGRGSVLLISGFLVVSASVRLITSATQVLAAEDADVTLPIVSEDRVAAAESPEPEQVETLVQALQKRERRVQEQELEIAVKMKTISIAKAEIERRLQALEEAENSLRATISLADEAAENDLERLTAVYENMKPKDASALFEEMDPNFAAGFLGRMLPESAAKIMAGLSPEVAYSVSAVLAGRNANVPTR